MKKSAYKTDQQLLDETPKKISKRSWVRKYPIKYWVWERKDGYVNVYGPYDCRLDDIKQERERLSSKLLLRVPIVDVADGKVDWDMLNESTR